METRAELPFTGDQVGLFRAQPGRAKQTCDQHSRSGARPMHPDWVRGLRDQVSAAGAKLFIKQIGSNHGLWPGVTGKGEDLAQWPADLRVQEVPS